MMRSNIYDLSNIDYLVVDLKVFGDSTSLVQLLYYNDNYMDNMRKAVDEGADYIIVPLNIKIKL